MGQCRRACMSVVLALVASAGMIVPTDLYAASGSSPTAAALTDVKTVAGRWSGILYGRPGAQRDQDWIEFALRDDGSYTLASARTIGVFEGTGKVRLEDGRLVTEGAKGG